MERVMTLATDKEQASLRAVGFTGKATARAQLAGIVGIHFDAEARRKPCLVVQKGMQLSKGPFGGMMVRLALLFARLLPMFAFGSVSDARQVFQANQTVGMGVQNVFTHGVVGLLF